jgi:NAD+ kinase
MKVAIYIGKETYAADPRFAALVDGLSAGGCVTYRVSTASELAKDTDMLLSVGGDGTFLSASAVVADSGIPVAGVNLGRMGFLSENRPEDLVQALLSEDYTIENRAMLNVRPAGSAVLPDECRQALNEMAVHRNGPSVLEVQVMIDGICLPSYWADGLIISTSSGSTAYSLSVGGPIVLPEAKVLIISPIAPHNLNVRPMVVPDTAEIHLRMTSRDGEFVFSSDNRSVILNSGIELDISVAQFSLRRVRLNRSNFINALTQKLFWGEDVRNLK